jgi:ketosteroid isomerase-like protein
VSGLPPLAEDEVRAAVDALGAAFLAGDASGALEMFCAHGDVAYAGPAPDEVATGRPDVHALLLDLFDRDERRSWRTEHVSVAVVCGVGAMAVVAETTLTVQPPGSAPPRSAPSRVSGVLQREDEGWRWRVFSG